MSDPTSDRRAFAPATTRNREPILAVLAALWPASDGPRRVLEIASGTGEHALFFAHHLPHVTWQPSDADPDARASIAAWQAFQSAGPGPLANLLPPLALDVAGAWPDATYDAIFCANMIHIAPWEACLALFAGAARAVRAGGAVVLYGPFAEGGRHSAPSNEAFDASLRARDPRWGVRDLDAVAAVAAGHGLTPVARHAMPANNLTLVFARPLPEPAPRQ